MPAVIVVWTLSSVLLIAGVACVVLRRQMLAMVLGLELMINAANVNLVYYAAQWRDAAGLAVALLIIAAAAAEVVVGFSLIIALSREGAAAETSDIRDLAG